MAVLRARLERTDVDTNAKDKYGRMLLSRVAEDGHESVAALLLERGDVAADPRDRAGAAPLSLALLKRKDVNVNSKMRTVKPRCYELPNTGTGMWYTPCWSVVISTLGHRTHTTVIIFCRRTPAGGPHTAETSSLLSDAQDRGGGMPLYYSTLYGCHKVVDALLELGDLNPNLKP